MTDRIIRLRGDDHHEAQMSLPWYATGRLDPNEHARVDAHVKGCPQCQADLRFEHWLSEELPDLPVAADYGWANLQGRLGPSSQARRAGRFTWFKRMLGALESLDRPWPAWAMAAPVALALVLGAALILPHAAAPGYRALGAAGAPDRGNMLIMFRPQTPESSLRRILSAHDTRLIDGPTPAGAYVLEAPARARASALAALRAEPDVLLAEPIDAATAR